MGCFLTRICLVELPLGRNYLNGKKTPSVWQESTNILNRNRRKCFQSYKGGIQKPTKVRLQILLTITLKILMNKSDER